MASMIDTIIFSPSDKPFDPARTKQRLAHISRRGYRLVAFVREWAIVERLLAAKAIQVVVFAAGDQLAVDHGIRDSEKPTWVITAEARNRALRLPLAADRVRQIIDDDATGPIGIDPETIAAARRIARHLNSPRFGRRSRSVQDPGCN